MVRDIMVQELLNNQKCYKEFVSGEYLKYITTLAMNKTWIGEVGLIAIVNAYGIKSCIVYNTTTQQTTSIKAKVILIPELIQLVYINNNHYNICRGEFGVIGKHFGYKIFGPWEVNQGFNISLATTKMLVAPQYKSANVLTGDDKAGVISLQHGKGGISIQHICKDKLILNKNNSNINDEKKIEEDSDIEVLSKDINNTANKPYINDDGSDIEILNNKWNDDTNEYMFESKKRINFEKQKEIDQVLLQNKLKQAKELLKNNTSNIGINNNSNNNSNNNNSVSLQDDISSIGSQSNSINFEVKTEAYDMNKKCEDAIKYLNEVDEESKILGKLDSNGSSEIKDLNNSKNSKSIGMKDWICFWKGNSIGCERDFNFKFLWMTNIGIFCTCCILFADQGRASFINYGSRSYSYTKQLRYI